MGQGWTSNLRQQTADIDSRPRPYLIPSGPQGEKQAALKAR